ncbi:hypothetical protein [Acinetobacter sp.]|uniref:hypothetical protein n=1 Tax=Acinetobacter sp. TaxID=472 RepID=UPI0031DE67E6
MLKNIYLALFILLITGCAIKPVTNENAKNVPNKRILNSRYLIKDDSKVFVIIKRDQGYVGSACTTQILIDGSPVANLRMSEKIMIYLSPEQHIISSVPQGICGGGIVELQIDLTSKKTATFRVGFDGNATHKIQPTVF